MNYQKIYNAIIEKAKRRLDLEEYFEKHHIIPKSLGGTDEETNLVKLSFREHYLCHRLLTKIYPEEQKMHYAFWTMSTNPRDNTRIPSRVYAEARTLFIGCIIGREVSQETKDKISKSNTGKKRTQEMKDALSKRVKESGQLDWTGKTHSEESKLKMSKSAKNRNIIEENERIRREKISNSHKGKILSEEHAKNISEAKKGEKNPMYGKKGKDNPRSKPVLQFSLENEFIKEWENAGIAARELNISYAGIRNCVTGKTKTSGKFI